MCDVEELTRANGLAEIEPVLKRGALVAQTPSEWDSTNLTEDERDALHTEVSCKWRHPMRLYLTFFICSIGAAFQYLWLRPLTILISWPTIEGGIKPVPTVQTYLHPNNSVLAMEGQPWSSKPRTRQLARGSC